MEQDFEFNWQKAGFTLLALVSAATHLYFNLFGTVSTQYQNTFHFVFFILLGSLVYPLTLRLGKSRLFPVGETALALLAAAAALFLSFQETAIYDRGGEFTTFEIIAGVFMLGMLIEYTRRVSGLIIPVIIILSLSYVTWLGPYLSGVFNFAGLSFKNILFRSIYGDDGIFGNLANISSTYVFLFILFGGFLQVSGAGDFIIDISRGLMSRVTGGQGFVAIMASALTGTISGSAVANTASTGVITIPLMKKAGYRPEFAAGIEAAASTGGQIMPPIMGAGAFVMASYTNIPYSTIVLLSIAPAILYFMSVFFIVLFESRKLGLKNKSTDNFKFWELMKKSGFVFVLPITLLITMLVMGYSPTYTAGFSILAVIVVSWFTGNKMTLAKIIEAAVLGSRNMIMTAIILLAIGLVVNSIVTAGVGNTFSLMISDWSGNSVLLALVLIALASLVLGMGLPVTASYIVLATLTAPALSGMIQSIFLADVISAQGLSDSAKVILSLADPGLVAELSVPGLGSSAVSSILERVPDEIVSMVRSDMIPAETALLALLSAHMVIFWLSQDSNVTPPVCLVAFTAAAIAKSSPMKTGFESWKLAKGLYIVPMLFAYTPLISGTLGEILTEFVLGIFGIFALAAAMQGFMHHRLGIFCRIFLALLSVAILQPHIVWLEISGTIILMLFYFFERKKAFSF